ncbi:hypothetical protein [Mycobacterium sp. TY815]|uniref:hypothetical protein n=1 Tax=Mycobacterium TaxID=1763 RepID=UPI00274278E9|nr:hypothetical protein [Mycobacterium sp. TY815]MDP7707558.1 hypothetical protein [Mycobacterium sp. TY815]
MDQLSVDLDALSRLLPQLRELAEQVKAGTEDQIHGSGAADAEVVPSLVAAQQMSTITLPLVKAAVANQIAKVAESIEDARVGFMTSDEQLLAAVTKVPTLLPHPIVV